MTLLSRDLLRELGIELTERDFSLLDEHFETTLSERVVHEVVAELNPEQAQQFIAMKNGTDDELMTWLRANVPQLSEIVTDEVDILLGELAEHSDAFSSSPPVPPSE
ncbi:MAG TPA: DUF5663 domain-containing protein [Verrucomicrobiae bacterium]|nr:DUF5663 domain-containing protein [Verrucomicrobiae bacterium]